MMVQHANGKVEVECANRGNPISIEKFDVNMEPLFYCQKCGEFSNDDPREVDPTECPKCHEHLRSEIDVEPHGDKLYYVYACGGCGHCWTVIE
jgi:Zn finger protein HypA/HybF involved in hydrogenase expression